MLWDHFLWHISNRKGIPLEAPLQLSQYRKGLCIKPKRRIIRQGGLNSFPASKNLFTHPT